MVKGLPIWVCCALNLGVGLASSAAWGDEGSTSPEEDGSTIGVVRHVGRNSEGPYAVIDTGSSDHYTIGLDVCFFDENSRVTACGTIIRTKPRAAGVQIGADDAAVVKEGQRAYPKGLGPKKEAPAKPIVRHNDDPEPNDYVESEHSQDDDDPFSDEAPEAPEPPLLRKRWSIEPVYALMLPIQANELKFNSNARASGKGTVWMSGKAIKSAPIGFTAAYHLPREGIWEHAFSIGYNFTPQSAVQSDYDLTDTTALTTSTTWQHTYRLDWRLAATVVHTDGFDVMAGAGLELAMATTKFTSTYTSSSASGDLAKGSISSRVLSIPVSVWYEKHMNGWNFLAGIDVGVPVKQQGKKAKGDVTYSEDTGTATKDIDAVSDAVNQHKAKACSLHFGLGANL